MKDRTAEKLKSLLNLVPLSIEGGYYNETYRSTETISAECLRGRYGSARSVCTAIYYLLEPGSPAVPCTPWKTPSFTVLTKRKE